MPILRDMIITATKGNRNARRRWIKQNIVPCEVLLIIWKAGIKFGTKPPEKGMRLGCFLASIWDVHKKHSKSDVAVKPPKSKSKRRAIVSDAESKIEELENKRMGASALHLYVDTVNSELAPNWRKNLRPKKLHLKWPSEKDGSVRPVRQIPKIMIA